MWPSHEVDLGRVKHLTAARGLAMVNSPIPPPAGLVLNALFGGKSYRTPDMPHGKQILGFWDQTKRSTVMVCADDEAADFRVALLTYAVVRGWDVGSNYEAVVTEVVRLQPPKEKLKGADLIVFRSYQYHWGMIERTELDRDLVEQIGDIPANDRQVAPVLEDVGSPDRLDFARYKSLIAGASVFAAVGLAFFILHHAGLLAKLAYKLARLPLPAGVKKALLKYIRLGSMAHPVEESCRLLELVDGRYVQRLATSFVELFLEKWNVNGRLMAPIDWQLSEWPSVKFGAVWYSVHSIERLEGKSIFHLLRDGEKVTARVGEPYGQEVPNEI